MNPKTNLAAGPTDPEPKEGWLYLEDIEKHKGRREWTRCWWRLDEGQLSYRMKKDDLEPRASITAAGIEVAVMPARTYYRTEQTVRVVATVIDIDENTLDAAEVAFTAEPASAVTDLGDGNFVLDVEGSLTFEACTVADGVTGEQSSQFTPPFSAA